MHASAAVPALLLNGSSSCATGHPVKYPGRGWASVRNIYIACKGFSDLAGLFSQILIRKYRVTTIT